MSMVHRDMEYNYALTDVAACPECGHLRALVWHAKSGTLANDVTVTYCAKCRKHSQRNTGGSVSGNSGSHEMAAALEDMVRRGEVDLDKLQPDNSQRAEMAQEIAERLKDATKELFALERMLSGNAVQPEVLRVARKVEATQRSINTAAQYLGGNITTEAYKRDAAENQRRESAPAAQAQQK